MNKHFEAVLSLSNMATNDQGRSASRDPAQLTDEELLVEFLIQNKVSKTCVEEVMRRGFASLYMLALAEHDDLKGPEIPLGQQRLIMHLVKLLKEQNLSPVTVYVDNPQSSSQTAHQAPAQDNAQKIPPQDSVPNPSQDVYSTILGNMLVEQQQLQSQSPATTPASLDQTNIPPLME